MDCPWLSNVDKSVPATDNQKTSSDRPSCKHGACDKEEEEEKRQEMLLLPMWPAHKNVLMALSLVYCAEVQVMPMTELQSHELNWRFLCQRYIRTFWNKSQWSLTVGNSELTSEFDKCEVLCASLHCVVKCFQVGSNHLQNKYKKGLVWLLN